MKTLPFLALSAAAGAALAVLAHAQFLAAFRAEYLLAAGAVAGVLAIMRADYGRKSRPLALPPRAPIVRPAAVVATPTPRSAAYGIRRRQSALVERAA